MHHTHGKLHRLLAALAPGLLALAAQAKPQQAAADALLAWNALATEAMTAFAAANPPGAAAFDSAYEAALADENGLSRILVRFHFRHAVDVGRIQGEQVGRWVFEHALGAVK
jgi:hypothetical protein